MQNTHNSWSEADINAMADVGFRPATPTVECVRGHHRPDPTGAGAEVAARNIGGKLPQAYCSDCRSAAEEPAPKAPPMTTPITGRSGTRVWCHDCGDLAVERCRVNYHTYHTYID